MNNDEYSHISYQLTSDQIAAAGWVIWAVIQRLMLTDPAGADFTVRLPFLAARHNQVAPFIRLMGDLLKGGMMFNPSGFPADLTALLSDPLN